MGNISLDELNFIFYEAERSEEIDLDSLKCSYRVKRIYRIQSVCVIP